MKVEAQEALRALYERDGALDPLAVVEAAEPEESPLHSFFEWDDGKAAQQHRLAQARKLIRVAVTIIPTVNTEPVRAYVSLTPLRRSGDGSYRSTVEVLSDREMRAQALADALRALSALERQYAHLRELRPVWAALSQILAAVKPAPVSRVPARQTVNKGRRKEERRPAA